jgi:hypothetical protein
MSILAQYAREARETDSGARGIAALAEGKLYALQNPFALDGRVSSYPTSARGFSVANSYVLIQSDAALLIDTGFGKDEPVICTQIESLIAPGLPLSLFPLRLNEFMSINNVEAFAGHFNVEQCYTSNIDAALWFDFGAKVGGRSILESMRVSALTLIYRDHHRRRRRPCSARSRQASRSVRRSSRSARSSSINFNSSTSRGSAAAFATG